MFTLSIAAYLSVVFHSLEDKPVTVLQQIICKVRKLLDFHLIVILILAPVPTVHVHDENGLFAEFASIVIQLLYRLVDKK